MNQVSQRIQDLLPVMNHGHQRMLRRAPFDGAVLVPVSVTACQLHYPLTCEYF